MRTPRRESGAFMGLQEEAVDFLFLKNVGKVLFEERLPSRGNAGLGQKNFRERLLPSVMLPWMQCCCKRESCAHPKEKLLLELSAPVFHHDNRGQLQAKVQRLICGRAQARLRHFMSMHLLSIPTDAPKQISPQPGLCATLSD